jgi:PAS domain S-box-containing protein
MDEPNLRERFEELQQKHTALLHEYEETKRQLGGPQAQLKLAIFDRLPMPVWACDRNCRIVFWNDAAARLYGYPAEEAIGKDFVDLYVNEPERAKARIDVVDIIDNNKPIKNMANDIDKHGNTRKLVTQCFALYNVGGHSGLQAEISYEVQDIERLQEELMRMQEEHRRARMESEELQRKLVDVTRTRAMSALDSMVKSVKDALLDRKHVADQAALKKDADQKMVAKIRGEIKEEKEKLIKWEKEMRKKLMSQTKVEDLEALIDSIEQNETFDV